MSGNTVMFPGSGDVYVKFHDIIGTPRFSVLVNLIRGRMHEGLFNTSFLGKLLLKDLIEWYVKRRYENFLDDPIINMHKFTPEQNEKLMLQMLSEVSYESFCPFNLASILVLHPIIERLHVYSKHNEPGIHEVAATMSNQVRSVDCPYGNFADIISNCGDHATLITTSTEDVRTFLDSKYDNRYAALIFPNEYDSIKNISDVYSNHSSRITVLDITRRIKIWEESLL